MRLVFPADYFNVRQPDEAFAEQASAFAARGHDISTFSFDTDQTFRPPLLAGETVLYRGWMLNEVPYQDFEAAVLQAGAQLLTDTPHYLLAHHIPNWYPLLSDLTPETVCITDLSEAQTVLERLNWDSYFVKDFVKSLKTAGGSRITQPEQVHALMLNMEKFRGEIEGGLCVRRVEDFLPETERRYFVINAQAYASDGGPIPALVGQCAQRIKAPFFSVDSIQRKDGQWRVVEIGDGQVSDLVGWDAQHFAELWSGIK